ncbi:MAG TPA: hypothetical protein VLL52_14365 [Anaerolineae bacterium]|nr:hypothetical protein [Anaerolineae bacterium]
MLVLVVGCRLLVWVVGRWMVVVRVSVVGVGGGVVGVGAGRAWGLSRV